MRVLLALLIAFLTLSAVFNFDPGPAPGVKIKNALLYLIVLALMFRMTLDRSYRLQLPAIPVVFGVLIAYSILTYATIVLVLDYSGYDWLRSGFSLKNSLIDYMLFFLVFFYGLRTREDALFMLKLLLACWALSHLVALADALGWMRIGDIEQRGDGRVQGTVGESNQYGAFVALSLPAIAAFVLATRGVRRAFWLAAAVMTAMTLIMTVSRGAFVAIAVAVLAGMYLFRRYVPIGKLLAFGGAAAVAGVMVVTTVIALGFGDLLYERMLGSASTGGDLGGVSSGRTEIWSNALAVMAEQPITLLTGYGWAAYVSMPFRYAAHNHYLANWFNLGLIGLACSVLLLLLPIKIARAAALVADDEVRPLLIGFVMATTAIAIAVFFVELYSPWLYFWTYAGIVMRLAVAATERASTQPIRIRKRAPAGARQDAHGWTTASSRPQRQASVS